MLSKIKNKLNQPVTNGIAFKIIICIDIIVLIACIRIANVRTTQDEETQDYIDNLERIIQKEKECRQILLNYIDSLKSEGECKEI